jgi:non-ribosomal peptide synthetase component E (peptide arylation enzyme)
VQLPCNFTHGLSSSESKRLRDFFMDQDSQISTSTVPVGYPAEDKEMLLLDEEGNQVGAGEAGEFVVKSRY